VFSKPSYQLTVEETLPKDSQLLPLDAEDLDGGKNGRLRFSIIGKNLIDSIVNSFTNISLIDFRKVTK